MMPFLRNGTSAVTRRRSDCRHRRPPAFTLIELVAVMAIVCILIGLILPAVQRAREAARHMLCRSNLMQIGVALHNYELAHGSLPPGSVDSSPPIQNDEKGYHFGWMVQILPHLEEANTYGNFDFSVSVHDPRNQAACNASLELLHCPSMWGRGSTSGYAACHHEFEAPIDVDNHGVMFANSRVTREDLEDGAANTIFAGENTESEIFGWAWGTRASLRNTGTRINGSLPKPGGTGPMIVPKRPVLYVGGFSSGHLGGANFLFGDGSVRFLNENITLVVYRQLGNRSDGELAAGSF